MLLLLTVLCRAWGIGPTAIPLGLGLMAWGADRLEVIHIICASMCLGLDVVYLTRWGTDALSQTGLT